MTLPQRRPARAIQQSPLRVHKSPCLVTFAVGLVMGALLDRQVMLGMGSNRLVDDPSFVMRETLEYERVKGSIATIDKDCKIPDCPVCEPCSNRSAEATTAKMHSTEQSNQQEPSTTTTTNSSTSKSTRQLQKSLLFPDDAISDLVAGMSRVDRDDFGRQFDLGMALDPTTASTQHVLVLYGSDKSLPSRFTTSISNNQQRQEEGIRQGESAAATSTTTLSPVLSVDDAFQNCQTVKLVLTQPTKKIYRRKKKIRHDAECLAIMSQWESQHVHKFVPQTASDATNIDSTANVTRPRAWTYAAARPDLQEILPEHVHANNEALLTYLAAIPSALQRLEPILEKASTGQSIQLDNSSSSKGSVIVMVCNYGQANLLTNFVCAARARHLSLDRIVVFATDNETQRLATSLGLHVFADDRIFGSIPQQAAHNYSDNNFGRVMMAKIYCVHMTLLLGYDVLFQDVDVVWYQSPSDYFHNLTASSSDRRAEFDIYFQHDGFHHPERFKPIAANTGLYYVRHNPRTRHLLDVFVRMGDHVLATKSHQATLTVLVNEHMSNYGLRVKVLGEEADLFPNGYAFQKGAKITRYMREENATKPILFHANWLEKNKKRPALEGTLNWFLQTRCFDDQTDELHRDLPNNVIEACCLATPCCESSFPGAN